MNRIYLDHNATAPLLPRVARRLAELGAVGNPSSIHAEGRRARALLDEARARVADWAGVSPDTIVFTSGGTEANALAIHAWTRRAESEERERTYVMDGGSHASVRENIERSSWRAVSDRERASLHLRIPAHNESGKIADPMKLVESARRAGAHLHIDAVQWPGRLPFHPAFRSADSLAISGHKIGAPMGAGALIVPRAIEIDPLVAGGGQEAGRRSGTPPLPAIVGLGEAIAIERDAARCRALAVRLRDRVMAARGGDATELSDCERGLAGTLLIAFRGIPGDVLVAALDAEGIAASYGSACSSGEQEPSPALLGMGVAYELARSAVRFSVGEENTEEEIDEASRRIEIACARVSASLASRS